MAGSALAAVALVWLSFTVAGITGPLGFAICFLGAFLVIYGIICWLLYGVLAMKDRLATLAIWSGALAAFVPLVGVILYVVIKGAAVVLADFPHFFIADMSGLTATSPVTAVGAGAAIVGTIEQVAIATIITVPLGVLTATYLVNNRNAFATVVSNVVDAMTGSPAIIAGLFIYLLWVVPQKEAGQTGFAAALSLSVMMLPIVTRASQEVIAIVPGSLKEAALALGSPQWRSVLRVMLPTARVGLVTAMILGIARVAGETAPGPVHRGGELKVQLESVRRKAGRPALACVRIDLPTRRQYDQGRLGRRVRTRPRRPDPVHPGAPHRGQEARSQRFYRPVAYPAFTRGSRSVSHPTQQITRALLRTRFRRPNETNETKESPRMRIAQHVMRTFRLTTEPKWCRGAIAIGVLCALSVTAMSAPAGAEHATDERANTTAAPINGGGSSFAAPAINTWINKVQSAPYSLSLQYATSNSGTGRYEFTNQTIDFGVSDIGYVGNTDTTPPSFPFNFIPITAGGIAFMYNVPGLTKQLQLSSETACGLLTGRHQELERPPHRR